MVELVVGMVCLALGAALGIWVAGVRSRAASSTIVAQSEAALAQAHAAEAAARFEAAQAREANAQMQARHAEQQAQTFEARQRSSEAEAAVAEARSAMAQAESRAAQAQAKLAGAVAERDAAVRRAAEVAADRASLIDQFKVLSAETLATQGRAAEASHEVRFKATQDVLSPVAEALAKMNERILEVEKTREGASAELREQVRSMVAMNESLRRETSALSTALRAPQVRGAWGEQSLKRIVEMSGLVERCDFFQQTSTRTDDGLFRPDLTIHLAGGKRVFVDSKAPLTALLDAYGTDDEALQAQHLKRFGKLVRSHVDDLSKKNYWALDAGSPEFVVMFLASEEIFHAALQEQPDLLEYAGSKQIVLASPSTLIGLLKTVAHGWKQAVLAESAEQVSSLGRELFDRISKLGEHFDGVGRALTQATTAYNKTVGSLEGRVMVTARKFNELEVTQAALPSVRVVKEVVRPLTAVELLDAPDELPVAEQAELRRALPSIDDLVEGTTPEEQPNRAAR